MWKQICATTSLAFISIISVQAQSASNGAVVINVSSDMLTCEPTSVQWVWTGATSDTDGRVINMAVEQVGGNDRRSLSEPSPVRLIRKRSDSKGLSHVRRAPINIAGGSNIPLSAGSWTWNSVGVPMGTYRMSLVLEPDSVVFFSDPFTVSQGPDTSCLGSLGASATSSAASQVLPAISTSVPATTFNSSETTTIANNITSTTASITPSSTNVSMATHPPTKTNVQSNVAGQSSHHQMSGGGIAAAIIIPLLVLGVLIYLCCMRRNATEDTSHSSSTKQKLSGFFNVSSSNSKRQISTPMDLVHSGGYTIETRGANDENEKVMRPTSENWVDFQPNTPDNDAHLVTSAVLDAMVRESIDQGNQRSLYQLGQNNELRQSQMVPKDRGRAQSNASSLPTYLQDANFESRQDYSSFVQDHNCQVVAESSENGVASELEPNPPMLERGNSKIRRKPAPTYSTYSTAGLTKKSVAAESLTFPLPESIPIPDSSDGGEEQGPFSDSHEVDKNAIENDGNHQEVEVMEDSPTLPQEGTPVNSMRSFPVSVYSTNIDSPSQRVLLGAQRESLSEEEKNRLYKLSIQMPQDERGFRVSF